jgi:hypothetical protein
VPFEPISSNTPLAPIALFTFCQAGMFEASREEKTEGYWTDYPPIPPEKWPIAPI